MAGLLFDSMRNIYGLSFNSRIVSYDGTIASQTTGGDGSTNNGDGGPALKITGDNSASVNSSAYIGWQISPLPASAVAYGPTFYCGVRMRCSTNTVTQNKKFFYLRNTSYGDFGILVTTANKLAFMIDDVNILSTSTSSITLTDNNYIEFWYYINNSSGRFVCKVNGTTFIDFTGDTQLDSQTVAHCIFLGCAPNGASDYTYFSDLYVLNDSGSVNNTFLGEIHSVLSMPTGTGTYSDFTASTGSTYTCIDEATASTTDYITTSTSGNKSTFTRTAISTSISDIVSVQLAPYWYRSGTGGTSAQCKPYVKSSSTEVSGANQTLTATRYYSHYVYDTDPNTSSAWTRTNLNAAEFGIQATIT